MWQPMAISHPPPSACPLMAATTGLGSARCGATHAVAEAEKGRDVGTREGGAEIGARAEDPVAGPGDDHGAHRLLGLELGQRRVELAHQRFADGIGGGRFRVMTAKDSSRATTMVSYGIGEWLLGARFSGARPRRKMSATASAVSARR